MFIERNNYVDFHCHSAMKPFGKSFNYSPIGVNSKRKNALNSIWRYNPPSLTDKFWNYILNLTKFSQANFTSLSKGGVRVVCVSLYPIEKGFFVNAIKNEFLRDLTANFATGVGKKRVDHIQDITDYYSDLKAELAFYEQLDGAVVKLPEGSFRYKIVANYKEIEQVLKEENNGITTIAVVLSIEGLHVLNSNLKIAPNEEVILQHLREIKQWKVPPFFVTIAHHFWNHLCGHAKSFTNLVANNVDQKEGMDSGITPLGWKVLNLLVDKSKGKRILIDIKHMNPISRNELYQKMDTDPAFTYLPIIVSHGAANGLQSYQHQLAGGSSVAHTLNSVDINFYNDELIRIAKSKGIIGLQLDERRVASKETLKSVKHSVVRSKIMHYRSALLWNQIQHIVEVLDAEGLFAWDCIVMGSDYDGIIDPLNGFWTAEEFPFLADFLERHAFNYLQNHKFLVYENQIEADEVVARVMSKNGLQFLEKEYT